MDKKLNIEKINSEIKTEVINKKDKNIKSFLNFASSKRKIVKNYKFNREECYAK